ncbi:hypothetical protein BJV77DRAFT_485770 [Russula vinacea]|nr:hypothetical protein BJV77DRAFT_485770 [Russula vinacea]
MSTHTVPLKYRRKSSPPPSPRMLSPIVPFSSAFISPPPKWLDSDDDLDHEPALTSDDALTVFSSSCSRAPSLAPLDAEDSHVDIVSSPVREISSVLLHPPELLSQGTTSRTPQIPNPPQRAKMLLLLSLPSIPSLVLAPLDRAPSTSGGAQPPPARPRRVVTPS